MPLVFAGVCSHAPGITERYEHADPELREGLYAAFDDMRERLEATRPDAIVVVAAEHFANFFMNNMPSSPSAWPTSTTARSRTPTGCGSKGTGCPATETCRSGSSPRSCNGSDVSYAEEWRFDHGIMVPLHFLTPRYDLPLDPGEHQLPGPAARPAAPGVDVRRVMRRPTDAVPERIAVIGTGGISHWPATPDSGKINEAWDRDFLDRWVPQRPRRRCRLRRPHVYTDAGQGGFEIRTFVAVSAARPRAPRGRCTSTRRSRSSPSAAPSRRTPWRSPPQLY